MSGESLRVRCESVGAKLSDVEIELQIYVTYGVCVLPIRAFSHQRIDAPLVYLGVVTEGLSDSIKNEAIAVAELPIDKMEPVQLQ